MCSFWRGVVSRLTAVVLLAGLVPVLSGCERVEIGGLGVYRIVAFSPLGGLSSGTGFLVNSNNVVATSWHVVANAEKIFILYMGSDNPMWVEATLIRADRTKDLALLSANRQLPGQPLRLAEYFPNDGTEVTAVGFPVGADIQLAKRFGEARTYDQRLDVLTRELRDAPFYQPSKTDGKVSRSTRLEGVGLVQHQAFINPGNSGGPLLDACGSVVGINTFQSRGAEGIFFSVSAKELVALMNLQGLSADTRRHGCYRTDMQYYMPYAVGLAALLLSMVTILFVFRRTAVVQRPYTAITRMMSGAGKTAAARPAIRAPLGTAQWAGGTTARPATRSSPAQASAGALKLIPIGGEKLAAVALDRIAASEGVVLGRHRSCDIVVDNKTVSKRHARLSLDRGGTVLIEDLGSGNGTWKGKTKISRDVLANDDLVRFGAAEYRVELPRPAGDRPDPAGRHLPDRDRPAAVPVPQGALDGNPKTADRRTPQELAWLLSGFDETGKVLQFSLEPGSNDSRTWTVGRKADAADLVIAHKAVSSVHARLRYTHDRGLEICDLGSSNGTTVDGKPVDGDYVPLDNARKIMFGGFEMTLSRN